MGSGAKHILDTPSGGAECDCRCGTMSPSYGGIVMESVPSERTLEWAIEPIAVVSPVEIHIKPPADLYFEIIGLEEPEVELIITI